MVEKSPFIKRHRSALITVAVLALVALTFTLSPVRAVASNLLKNFRVQEVKVVPVSVSHLENIENNDELQGPAGPV